MNYLKIKNKGLIEFQALDLLGGTTKANDSSKIGQFGSGNKYALAYFLRNNYDIKIFAGLDEIKVSLKEESFRGESFEIIYINDKRTSITTKFGTSWKCWQAIREIYCNAMDEGESSIDLVENINPIEDETHYYIEATSDIYKFLANFNDYFSTKKKVLFECDLGQILEKTGVKANVYRKQIKCLDAQENSIYDYNFNEIEIDENRLIKYSWSISEKIWELIFRCESKEVIMNILHNSADKNMIENYISEFSAIQQESSATFQKCISENKVVPQGFAGLLSQEEIHEHIILPTKIFNAIRGNLENINLSKHFQVSADGCFYRDLIPNKLQQETIDQALYFFKEVNFEIPYTIKLGLFDEKKILGTIEKGCIILSDVLVEKGINETVNTIIEELIHLKYKVRDETRGFQTAVITEFISYMKKVNSFVI